MESGWYLKIADKEVGPLTPRQLRAMADRGQISPYDPVRRGIEGRWVPAGSVRGLLAPNGSAAEQPPPGGLPVAEPLETLPGVPGASRDAEPTAGTGPKPGTAGGAPAGAAETVAGTADAAIPVAQPAAKPPTPPVAATPVSGASSAGPFAVEAGDDPLVFRHAGRHRGMASGSRRRRRQEAFLVAGVMLVVALGAVCAALLLSGKGPTRPPRASAPTPAPVDSGDEESGGEEGAIAGLDEYLEELGLDGAAGGSSGEVPSERGGSEGSAAEGWTDASTSSAECGDVRVKITGARIDRPRLIGRASGVPARGTKDYLCLQLELTNRREAKAREYRRWSVDDPGVMLFDDRNKRYPMKSFARRGLEIDGQVAGGETSLLPGEATAEMLVFERPGEGGTHLRLRLPASAFGEEGSLKFKIPVSMIAVSEAPQESGRSDASDRAAEGAIGDRAAPEPDRVDAAQPAHERGPIPIPGLTGEPSREGADDAGSPDDAKRPEDRGKPPRRQATGSRTDRVTERAKR